VLAVKAIQKMSLHNENIAGFIDQVTIKSLYERGVIPLSNQIEYSTLFSNSVPSIIGLIDYRIKKHYIGTSSIEGHSCSHII
jgi:hypothetical protein